MGGLNLEKSKLELLLISLGDRRYGIDTDQIAKLMNVKAGQSAVSFARLMTGHSYLQGHAEKFLLIKEKEMPILINNPDEVAVFPISAICSLPNLLAPSAGKKGVWGLLPESRGVIILIDLYKNQLFKRLSMPKR